MPAASDAQDTRQTPDTAGTAGQNDQTNADANRNDADQGQLPATASPLGLICWVVSPHSAEPPLCVVRACSSRSAIEVRASCAAPYRFIRHENRESTGQPRDTHSPAAMGAQ